MPETRTFTCIVCPMGCHLEARRSGNETIDVNGQGCRRGSEYARNEWLHPVRVLTTTIRVKNGCLPVAPIKSAIPLPKETIRQCMAIVNDIEVQAPLKAGQVVVADVLGTGINLIATRDVSALHSA